MRGRFLIPVLLLSSACAPGRPVAPAPPDPLSREEILARLLTLEDQRSLGSGAVQSFLGSEDPSIRRRAALVAGRIGDRLIAPRLAQALGDPVVDVRRAAALGLGFLGAKEGTKALLAALGDSDPLVRGRAAEALSRIGGGDAAAAIAEAFLRALPPGAPVPLVIRGDDPGSESDPWIELRLELVALARLKDAAALRLVLMTPAGVPRLDWWVAVWAAMRVGDRSLLPVLATGAATEDPAIRALAARGLGALKDPGQLEALRRLSSDKDPRVVREALRALASIGVAEGSAIAAAFLDSPNLILRREALNAIAALPRDSRRRPRVIDNVGHADPWIRAAAWPALIGIDAEDAGLVLSTAGPDPDWRVRASIAGALAATLGERSSGLLQPYLRDEDPRVITAALGAATRALKASAAPLLERFVTHNDVSVRTAAIEGLSSLRLVAGHEELLERAYDASLSTPDFETRLSLVDALSEEPGEKARALLRRVAASDPARVLRQRALASGGEGFAGPESVALRDADARRLTAVYEGSGGPAFAPRAVLITRRGRIEIALDLVDAPLATASFVRLARSGFYNGLTFHRVVPGFVAQGGDPRGDGNGGPGFAIRCEYSGRPFGRGALGMALSGKDTGGSQFFITLEPQPHLDGAYAQFGQVIAGMEVADRLTPGDVIERVEVFDGRETP